MRVLFITTIRMSLYSSGSVESFGSLKFRFKSRGIRTQNDWFEQKKKTLKKVIIGLVRDSI